MTPNSSILAWKIPRAEEPGRPQSVGSPIIEHVGAQLRYCFTLAAFNIFFFDLSFFKKKQFIYDVHRQTYPESTLFGYPLSLTL